jgi:hypothetical protein
MLSKIALFQTKASLKIGYFDKLSCAKQGEFKPNLGQPLPSPTHRGYFGSPPNW